MSEHNPVVWWELQVPDLAQAKAFYGGVFGWTFDPWQDGYEVINNADGKMIGGLHQVADDPVGRRIDVVFDVEKHPGPDTLEQHLERVEAHGGKILKGRTEIAPGMGWYASVADPSGLPFDLATDRPAS